MTKLARCMVTLATIGALACGDVGPMLHDAAVLFDAAADAQVPPTEPVLLTCPTVYQRTTVFNSGQPTERTNASEWHVEQIIVQDPRQWLVEFCGKSTTSMPALSDVCDTATCTGAPPPVPDCYFEEPGFTGTTIQVTCSESSSTTTQTTSSNTMTTFRSVRLVPHT
jgi:hypothetical protein